ncbi:MAG: carbohydrate ABC transporter permease [Bacilli bacterium]
MEEKRSGIISRLDMRRPTMKMLYIFLFLVILLISIVCFLPPLWIIVRSLEPAREFYSVKPSFLPQRLDWRKVQSVWSDANFLRLYLNSAIVTFGSLFTAVLFSALLGFVLSRLKPVGSKLIFTIVIWTLMVPTTTAMVPVYENIVKFPLLGVNLINSYVPLWLLAGANPFFVIVFKSFFDGIPMDLLEAAQLDGCSSIGLFTRIMLPLSRPVIFTISIFSIIGSWSDFFWPYLVLQNSNLQTVMVGVFNLSNLPSDQQFVALTLAMLPMIIVFLILQKYIMGGLTIGGIKG